MPKVAGSKQIFEAALSYEYLNPQERMIPETPKVSGVWDTFISTIYPRNEVTNERTLAFLPKAIERLIGNVAYRSLVATSGGLSFQSEKKQLVEQVKNNLLPHIRREFDWDIQLVSSKSMNACALPGGKIIICEGIIDNMVDYLRSHIDKIQPGLSNRSNRRQAEVLGKELQSMMAAVISHEIAHSDIGHARSRIEKMILIYVLLFIGYLLTFLLFIGASNQIKKEAGKNSSEKGGLLRIGASFFYNNLFRIGFSLYNLSHSRGNEYEADAMGMQVYMHEAGYDLNGTVRLMDMFCKKKISGHFHNSTLQKIEEFFSTHPLSENRKKRAEEIRDKVSRMVEDSQDSWLPRIFGY